MEEEEEELGIKVILFIYNNIMLDLKDEIRKTKKRVYYENNKEKINEIMVCELCLIEVLTRGYIRHEKSIRHRRNLEMLNISKNTDNSKACQVCLPFSFYDKNF
tara:strand:- start:59 stop:370 length:312 start_codon:yes stop_codon:yes gene_type:complete